MLKKLLGWVEKNPKKAFTAAGLVLSAAGATGNALPPWVLPLAQSIYKAVTE